MAQIPRRNMLNIKLGSDNGIQANQTRKIDFLSYNDLYNYAINGAAKEFEAKYSDVTFKAGSQEAINVAGLHKEDFMSTTKEALLEELHTELLKTKQTNDLIKTPTECASANSSMYKNAGLRKKIVVTGEFPINSSNAINKFSGSLTPMSGKIIETGSLIPNKGSSTSGVTGGVDSLTMITPAEEINEAISDFTDGKTSVAELKKTLNRHNIKYIETSDGNYDVISFEYETDNGQTKKCTVRCNSSSTSSSYTLEDLKEEGITNESFINKYFKAVYEENGKVLKYTLKAELGFKNVWELYKALRNNLILTNYLNKSSDEEYNLEKLSDGRTLNSSIMDDYSNELGLMSAEEKKALVDKVIEKFEKDYYTSHSFVLQMQIFDALGLKKGGREGSIEGTYAYVHDKKEEKLIFTLNGTKYIFTKPLSSKSSENLSAKLYSSDSIEHLSNREINKYFTPVVTENGAVKQYIIKEGVSATEVEYLINKKPVGNNIKLKRMISSNSTDEIVQFIKDLLNNKISAQTGLKGDENIKVGHIANGNAFGDKVIETFVNNILMKYCEAYNTNEFSVNMILEGLKSYLASMQKMDMKTDTEGLVKEYKADEFLTAFAKENYGNTNADNVMSQLLLNVKKVYTATTGNNCKYSDDQIKKLINTMLQSNSNSNISAYTIIDNITAVLQEIDLSANEITTDSIKDLSNGLENVLEEYAKICIEAQNYVTTQLKNNSPISFDDYLKYIKSKYPEYNSNEYDEDLKGALVLGITQRLQKAGATNDDILEILEALFKEPSNEIDSSNSSSRSAAHAKKMNNPLIVTPSGIIIDENTSNATSSFIHWWLGIEDKKTTGSEAIQEMIDTFSNIGNITDSDDGWITLRRFIAGICPYVSQLGGIASVVKSAEDLWSMDNPTFGDYAIFTVDAFLNISGFGKTAKKGLQILSTKSKILNEILRDMEKYLDQSSKKVLNFMDKIHDLIAVNTWNKIKDSLITKKPRSNGQGNDVPQGGNNTRPSGGGSGIGGTSVGGSDSSSTTTNSSNNNYSGNTQGSDSGKTQDNGSNKNDSNSGNNNSQNPDLRDIFGDIDYSDRFGGNPSSSNDDSLNDDFDMTDFGNNGNLNDILGWQSDSNIDHSNDSHGSLGSTNPEYGSTGSTPTNSWKDGAWTAEDRTRDGKADTWSMQTQDENGNMVTYEQRDTDGDGVADACYRYYTDANGATVKESTQRFNDGATVTSRTYTDKEGNVTRSVHEAKDANGNVTNVKTRNKDGSTTSAEVSRDADGNIVLKQTQTDANGNKIEQTQHYDKDGYDEKGFDIYGFDRDGFNKDGYNKDGYNRNGFNKEGYNKDGFNKDGYDKDGYDKNGNNINGSYDYNHNTNLTDAQKNVVGNYLRGDYTNPDGSFDNRRFYNDMANVGWGAYVSTFEGDSAQKAFRDLQNGASVEDIFNKYGSGIHGSSSTSGSGHGSGSKSGSGGGGGLCGGLSVEERNRRAEAETEALAKEMMRGLMPKMEVLTYTTLGDKLILDL